MLAALAVYAAGAAALLVINAALVVMYPKHRNDWVLLAYACVVPMGLHVWLAAPWGLFAVCGLVDAEILRTGFYSGWKFRYVALVVHMLSAIAVPFAPPLVSVVLAIAAPLLLMGVGEIRHWRKFGFARDVAVSVAMGAVVAQAMETDGKWVLVVFYFLALSRMLLCTAALPPWKRFYTSVADLADLEILGMRAVCLASDTAPEVWAAMQAWIGGKRAGRDPETYAQAKNLVLAEIQGADADVVCAELAQRLLLQRFARRTRLWRLQGQIRRDLLRHKRARRADAILGTGAPASSASSATGTESDMGTEFQNLGAGVLASGSGSDSSESSEEPVTYAKWGDFAELPDGQQPGTAGGV